MTITPSNQLSTGGEQPLVSIVTPSYNQAVFISETIASVLKQDYPHIEYMVFDGGSTDNTANVLKSYGDRFYWVSEKDKGQSNAINKGWKKSSGAILAYLNSDDTYYSNNVVSQVVEFFRRNPEIDIVYGGSVYTNKDGKEIGTYNAYPFDYDKMFSSCGNPIPQPSAFIRRKVIDAVGYFDEDNQYSMDLDYWLRAGLHCKIAYLPNILSTFRLHSSSKSVSAIAKAAPEVLRMYHNLFIDPALPLALKQQERKIMARVYQLAARQLWQGRDWPAVSKSFWSSWKRSPTVPTVKDYVKWAIALFRSGFFRQS